MEISNLRCQLGICALCALWRCILLSITVEVFEFMHISYDILVIFLLIHLNWAIQYFFFPEIIVSCKCSRKQIITGNLVQSEQVYLFSAYIWTGEEDDCVCCWPCCEDLARVVAFCSGDRSSSYKLTSWISFALHTHTMLP